MQRKPEYDKFRMIPEMLRTKLLALQKTPLYDLLVPGQAVPPEYWGLDWMQRIQMPGGA